MAAGVGFVHYPQSPGPTAAQVGRSAADHAFEARLKALAQGTPGFLPYTGAGIGGHLGGQMSAGGPMMPGGAAQMAGASPMGAMGAPQSSPQAAMPAQPPMLGLGAALLNRRRMPPGAFPPPPPMGGPTP